MSVWAERCRGTACRRDLLAVLVNGAGSVTRAAAVRASRGDQPGEQQAHTGKKPQPPLRALPRLHFGTMLADPESAPSGEPTTAADTSGAGSARRPRGWKDRLAETAAFGACAGIVIAYALPGGAYDVVVRQEYGFVVWTVLAAGFATGLLPRTRPARQTLAVLAALCAYTAWTGASFAWTQSAERTTTELVRAVDYLGLSVLLASVIDRARWRSAATGLGAGAMVVCCLSVASRLIPSAFPANAIESVLGIDRLSYPFGYWNAVGTWGAMSVAIGLGWSSADSSTLRRVIALGATPVAGTMLYLSYSRAGLAALALALVLIVGLGPRRWTALFHVGLAGFGTALTIAVIRDHAQIANGTGTAGAGAVIATLLIACALCAGGAWVLTVTRIDRARLRRPLARGLGTIAAVIAVLAAAAVGPHLAGRAWHEFRHTKAPAQGANPTQRLTTLAGSRYSLWAVALRTFERQPLTGTGAGTYEFDWNRDGSTDEFVLNAHSIWFETMAEIGAPGLAAIAAFAIAAVALLLRVRLKARRRSSQAAANACLAVFAVFLLSASVDWMWQMTAVTVLALGGLVVSSLRLTRGRLQLGWIARIALTLTAAAAVWLQIPGLLSTVEVRRSQAAERRGDGPAALEWADAAAAAEPWAATPYEQKALVLESGHRFPAAAAAEQHAIDHEPTNYTHWLILARIETERGQLDQAVRDYEQARSLRPRGDVFTLQVDELGSAIRARSG